MDRIDADTALMARARRAYEWDRLRKGLESALWGTPAVVLAIWRGCPRVAWWLAPVVLVLAVFLVWRGGAAGRGVIPGLLAGCLPIFVRMGVGCCAMSGTFGVAVFSSILGGLTAGLAVSAFGLWLHKARVELLSAGILAGLAGAMSCSLFGAGEIVGLAVGLALGAAPVVLVSRRSA